MSNKRRTPDVKELSLWQRMMEGVKRLHDEDEPSFADMLDEPKQPPKPKRTKKQTATQTAVAPTMPLVTPDITDRLLDRRTDEKLARGKMPIEATLDLHGMTQAEAHTRLDQFVTQSYQSGKRCILVITGKGSRVSGDNYILSERSEKGVLKARLPQWLRQAPLDSIVLKSVSAHQKHGGSGAFYIYLRNRDKNY